MAVTHFIPEIWSHKILDNLEVKCKLVGNCNRNYEGDISDAGDTVHILGVGDPTVGTYTRNTDINIELMSDDGQELLIDQSKYFAFYVDDVDRAQAIDGLVEEYQRKASHKLAVARDTYVAGLIKAATNATTAEARTKEGIKEAIDAAIVALRERNFDEDGVIEVTPGVYNLFKNELITLSTDNPEYIKKGIVGMYDGFEVVMTNTLAKDATYEYCDIRGKKAIAFAGQLTKVEAARAEKRFSDIIKGLDVYGAKVIDEERIQRINVPVAS